MGSKWVYTSSNSKKRKRGVKVKILKVFIEEFKGNDLFSIWEVDTEGNKTQKFPVVSFGLAKALAIVKCIEELNAFVEARKK